MIPDAARRSVAALTNRHERARAHTHTRKRTRANTKRHTYTHTLSLSPYLSIIWTGELKQRGRSRTRMEESEGTLESKTFTLDSGLKK